MGKKLSDRHFRISETTEGKILGVLTDKPDKRVWTVSEWVGGASYIDCGHFYSEKEANQFIKGEHWLKPG